MTYEQLQKANEAIKTTNIKGKAYAEVPQRINAFRSVYPNGRILTELVKDENGVCVFKASVFDEDGNLLGTGHAYEKENGSFINKTSYIENCETSAVGRALGMCGFFGNGNSVASYEEVANAIKNQSKTDYSKDNEKYCAVLAEKKGVTSEKVMQEAVKAAGTDDGEAVCKVLCAWMRKAND